MRKEIYYITGAGRSGTTLFDICLGNLEHTFSLGEVIFFVQNGIIDQEYCSCGQKVTECEFWKKIISKWESEKSLSHKDFIKTQESLTRNKATFKNIYRYFFPTNKQKLYYKDLQILYNLLFDVTKKPVLIDSSKNAHYILILRKLNFKIRVLHLTRKFSGVLNSAKKHIKLDPSAGVETELKPMRFNYILPIWFIDNTLPVVYSIGLNYKRIKYENLINNPEQTLSSISKLTLKEKEKYKNRGPLSAEHLVAGNKMRMAEIITIQNFKSMNWDKNVKYYQKKIASIIDLFY